MRDASDNTAPPHDSYDKRHRDMSSSQRHREVPSAGPQPVITLTDMTDNAAAGGIRQQILYSEDFDAIQDYLQNTDSPMVNLSPSWLCKDVDPSVFSRQSSLSNGRVTPATNAPPQMSAIPIDMSSSIESASSSLHACEVCCHSFCSD